MRLISYSFTIHLFLEYVAEALGTRTHATHVKTDLENYGTCMLVQVKEIGSRTGGSRHQTACVDVLFPFQASHLVC